MNKRNANIIGHFIDRAKENPTSIAIIHKNKTITYDDLYVKVQKRVDYLSKNGVGEGMRILILVSLGIDFYVNLLSLFYIGATAVIIEDLSDRNRVNSCVDSAECQGVIINRKSFLILPFFKSIRSIKQRLWSTLEVKKKGASAVFMAGEDSPALITFTSGSTDTPKAALRTHGFLITQYDILKELIKPYAGEYDLVTLPIVMLINLGVGASSILPPKQTSKLKSSDIAWCCEFLKENSVDRITASPGFLSLLAKHIQNQEMPHRIQRIFTGGGPLFPNQASKICKVFNPKEFVIVYGSTEVEPISTNTANELLQHDDLNGGLCVGKLYDGIELKVIGSEKNELESGQVGEFIVRGKHVLDSYYNNTSTKLSNKILIGGNRWHRTGDSGFTRNGLLFLTGRSIQMISIENKVYSPFIFENKLEQLNGINKGTILQHDKLGLVLVVELKHKKYYYEVKTQLERFNLPQYSLHIVKRIPLDYRHRTKIDYHKLHKIIH